MRKLFLLLFLLTACVTSRDPFARLEAGDYTMVELGKYPHTTKTVRDLTQLDEPVEASLERLRRKVAARFPLLEEMTDSLFPEEEYRLFFKYKFTSIDTSRERLIVRYFAPVPYPEIFAGYQCQFVLDLQTGTLKKIFLSRVPLE